MPFEGDKEAFSIFISIFFALLLDITNIVSIFAQSKNKAPLNKALWRVRLGVRTLASHAGNTGSIPVLATKDSSNDESFFCA